ncbi:hypothetical protein LX36DRAFT_676138 [Colletotrichum falcatum]|nr:hypothetical protein LX36DRAFT_676138 [Colletotrichum falcatum]
MHKFLVRHQYKPIQADSQFFPTPPLPAEVTEGGIVIVASIKVDDPPVRKRAIMTQCRLIMRLGGVTVYDQPLGTTDGTFQSITSAPAPSAGTGLLEIKQSDQHQYQLAVHNRVWVGDNFEWQPDGVFNSFCRKWKWHNEPHALFCSWIQCSISSTRGLVNQYWLKYQHQYGLWSQPQLQRWWQRNKIPNRYCRDFGTRHIDFLIGYNHPSEWLPTSSQLLPLITSSPSMDINICTTLCSGSVYAGVHLKCVYVNFLE